jgi:Holliday junction resolvase RusA-like endonuclease
MSAPRAIQFEVLGAPRGKARPRSTRAGGRPYADKRTALYEALIADAALDAMAGEPMLTGAVGLHVAVYMANPLAKPDLDNIIKAVLDACNGVAFKDDAQVCGISAAKFTETKTDTARIQVLLLEAEEKRRQ